MALDENPSLVFDANDCDPSLTTNITTTISQIPLILIHDGGGTSFAYYCLNPVFHRPIYEIHNPRFASDVEDEASHWPGGIPEMARHYADLIRRTLPPGEILLGGWSLGGILALEVARVLLLPAVSGEEEKDDGDGWRVVGIVMVDSVCPAVSQQQQHVGREKRKIVPFRGEWEPSTKPETIARVTRCFAEARRAVAEYVLPDCWGREGRGGGGDGVKCPRAILLRAREAFPVGADEVSFVDTVRDDRSLGWDLYREGFFEEVIDVPGHHFNVFAWEHIDVISEKLAEACRRLEGSVKPPSV